MHCDQIEKALETLSCLSHWSEKGEERKGKSVPWSCFRGDVYFKCRPREPFSILVISIFSDSIFKLYHAIGKISSPSFPCPQVCRMPLPGRFILSRPASPSAGWAQLNILIMMLKELMGSQMNQPTLYFVKFQWLNECCFTLQVYVKDLSVSWKKWPSSLLLWSGQESVFWILT